MAKSYYKKKEFIIMGVTCDQYELPVKTYLSIEEMCEDLHIKKDKAYNMLASKSQYRRTKLRYIKVKV